MTQTNQVAQAIEALSQGKKVTLFELDNYREVRTVIVSIETTEKWFHFYLVSEDGQRIPWMGNAQFIIEDAPAEIAELSATEIESIVDGDSVIVNGVEAVFEGGKFFATDMPLMSQWDTGITADWHDQNPRTVHPLTKDMLVRDAQRAKYGLPCRYQIVHGGAMTIAKKRAIGAYYERVYGES